MPQKILPLLVMVILIIVIGLSTLELGPQRIESRESYRTFRLFEDPRFNYFLQEYEDARQNHASWIADPITVALRIAGYPNVDGTSPDEIHSYYENSTKVAVIIQDSHLMDDSVTAKEVRVDLKFNDGEWEIEWAGGRWRCHAGRGHRDWSSKLCN